tara:strand:+ start:40 stop:330 length:291 start_codon:yes stop_codon:yes gene_type:complete
MGRGGGPIGAIFRGVAKVVKGIGSTVMGGLANITGKKKKAKPAPSESLAKEGVGTAAAALGVRKQRSIGYSGQTSTILGSTEGVTEDVNRSQATLG